MSKQETPEPTAGTEGSGLGFSSLSMNEIAPAVTTAPSEEEKRMGLTWFIALAVLALLIGGGWLLRSSLNFPPPQAVQDQVRTRLSATPFYRDRALLDAKFVTGDTLRLEFTATLNTENSEHRAVIRQATVAAMKELAAAIPQKDLTVVGYEDDHKVVEARYLPQSALTNTKGGPGNTDLDMIVSVEHGENDRMGDAKGHTSQPGAAAGVTGGQ